MGASGRATDGNDRFVVKGVTLGNSHRVRRFLVIDRDTHAVVGRFDIGRLGRRGALDRADRRCRELNAAIRARLPVCAVQQPDRD